MFLERDIYRIRALKDFNNVKAGDIGGWVCSEYNLSQEGNCWIYDNANCLDNARIFDNAKMFDNAIMFDNAKMYDNAIMYNDAIMYNNAKMFNSTIMYDDAIMYNNATMFGDSTMLGNAKMFRDAKLKNCILYGAVATKFEKIFQYYCENRLLTSILTKENEILYSIGCQTGITKEVFIDRIYNDCEVEGNGLEEYPHRQEYLDVIDMAENYLRKFI